MSYRHIPGYSGFLHIYDEAVERAKDGAIFVEVGVALGHSLAYLARKVIDSGKKIEVWAVDPWEGVARNGEQQEMAPAAPGGDFGLFCRMMLEHEPDALEVVRVLRTTSRRASKLFASMMAERARFRGVDLVLIDGAHDADSVFDDIDAWWRLIAPGGVLAGDDHEPKYPGVQEACERMFGVAGQAGGYSVRGTAWEITK